jgi:hypothetical protein
VAIRDKKKGGMMITFEFVVNKDRILEERKYDLLIDGIAILENSYFVLPVRLNINGIEMFEYSMNGTTGLVEPRGKDLEFQDKKIATIWLELPILHLSITGLESVKKACNGEKVIYNLPEGVTSLQFIPIEKSVEVISEISGRKSKIECSELLKAFEDFSSKTRAVLEELVPELKQNPEIAYWFVKSG